MLSASSDMLSETCSKNTKAAPNLLNREFSGEQVSTG